MSVVRLGVYAAIELPIEGGTDCNIKGLRLMS